jgi:hypothetical protein
MQGDDVGQHWGSVVRRDVAEMIGRQRHNSDRLAHESHFINRAFTTPAAASIC